MTENPTRNPRAQPDDHRSTEKPDEQPHDRADAPVRQDDALTHAERLPRRGDHEIPPGNDTSV